MIAALLALLLCASSAGAEAETIHVTIAIAPDAAGAFPTREGLQGGLQTLFAREFGRFAELSFDPASPPGSGDATVTVSMGITGSAVSVSTDMRRSGSMRSLASTVPRGAPASLLSTMAADIAFLLFSSRGFATLPLAAAPGLTGFLLTDTLGQLTGWNPEDLEPLSLAANGRNITVCFPHAWLTLGPDFRIVAESIRDLHALEGGREQLQLSGLAAGSGDQVVLLCESAGIILDENPRLGTRLPNDAPGLPARPGLLLDRDTLAVPAGARDAPGLLLYSLAGGERRRLSVAASYVSACARDREGNIWAWDAGERRIRILTPGGDEVFSVRPLVPASTMQLPQQMDVLDDGGFLLAGSGEIWKFESTGIPVWRLTRIPGRPGEQLPSSFSMAADTATGAFTILDQQSRRLIAFSAGPAAAGLPALLTRLDGRRQADLKDAADAAAREGLLLMAWQLSDQRARLGGSGSDRAAARIAIVKDKASLYVQYADSLTRELLYARADVAWLRAGEVSRELAAESPGDPDAAALVQSVVARRLEVRAALARVPELSIISATAEVVHDAACAVTLTVHLRAVNKGPVALNHVRLHCALPSLQRTPALAGLDTISPGEEKDLDVTMASLELDTPVSGDLPAAILLTYDRGIEGISSAFTLPVHLQSDAATAGRAHDLGCLVVGGDPLLRAAAEELAAASGGAGSDAFSRFAAAFESLSRARAQAAHMRGTGGSPGPADRRGQQVRASLRSLSPDEQDWAVLSVSLAASLGLDAGLLSAGDRVCAIVDTGISIENAIASHPDLDPFKALLTGISRAGTLWVPLDARSAPLDSSPLAVSVSEAARLISSVDMKAVDVWRASAPSTRTYPVPVPFPLVLPPESGQASPGDAISEIIDGLRRSLVP